MAFDRPPRNGSNVGIGNFLLLFIKHILFTLRLEIKNPMIIKEIQQNTVASLSSTFHYFQQGPGGFKLDVIKVPGGPSVWYYRNLGKVKSSYIFPLFTVIYISHTQQTQ